MMTETEALRQWRWRSDKSARRERHTHTRTKKHIKRQADKQPDEGISPVLQTQDPFWQFPFPLHWLGQIMETTLSRRVSIGDGVDDPLLTTEISSSWTQTLWNWVDIKAAATVKLSIACDEPNSNSCYVWYTCTAFNDRWIVWVSYWMTDAILVWLGESMSRVYS